MATVLEFEDTDEFYEELKELMEAEEEIKIETDFTNKAEVPEKLRKTFKMHNVLGAVSNPAGVFRAKASEPSELNAKPLWVMGGAAAGAAAGAALGAVGGGVAAGPGAAIGGAIGTITGSIAANSVEDSVEIAIEVNTDGELTIRATPKNA